MEGARWLVAHRVTVVLPLLLFSSLYCALRLNPGPHTAHLDDFTNSAEFVIWCATRARPRSVLE